MWRAGRGSGKTRAASEFINHQVQAGVAWRVGLIGRTVADVRDVMVEGQSGILATCPPGLTAEYQPSRRRITWSNGAIAMTYSAEEPSQLRGPEHDCFVAGTMIATLDGEVPVESLNVGDLVLTRGGIRRVIAARSRLAEVGRVSFSSGAELIGTAEHPVLTAHGWTSLRELTIGSWVVSIVADIAAPSSDRELGTSVASVVSTWEVRDTARVYNLTVEGEHEYFANGILVHNCLWCDETSSWQDAHKGDIVDTTWNNAMLGLRLGSNPRCIVSSTPKRNKLTKDICSRRTTIVSEMSTYENRDNLPESFIEDVIGQYVGTSLEQQEVYGQLLNEVEGALWDLDIISQFRVPTCPTDIVRIVIGVDPAVSSGENADETGIIVMAKGRDGHGYVLDDRTVWRVGPDLWAQEVVNAYREWEADRVIAEVNNGGDMVPHTIQMVDTGVPVEVVTATRGKLIRAEPLSTAYRRGLIHHVGVFAVLENQMCEWTPDASVRGKGVAKSPDRLDALVYAARGLGMLGGSSGWEKLYSPAAPQAIGKAKSSRGWGSVYQ